MLSRGHTAPTENRGDVLHGSPLGQCGDVLHGSPSGREHGGVLHGSPLGLCGGVLHISLLHPATPRGGDQAVMPTPRGRRLPIPSGWRGLIYGIK
jgi:hypothetical protein